MNECDLCGKEIPTGRLTFGDRPMNLCWDCWHIVKEPDTENVLQIMEMMEWTPMREQIVNHVIGEEDEQAVARAMREMP